MEIGFILLTVFGFIEFNRAADVVRMVVIIIFRMTVTECLDYQGMFEASSRKWVKPVEVGRWSNDHELSTLLRRFHMLSKHMNNWVPFI